MIARAPGIDEMLARPSGRRSLKQMTQPESASVPHDSIRLTLRSLTERDSGGEAADTQSQHLPSADLEAGLDGQGWLFQD